LMGDMLRRRVGVGGEGGGPPASSQRGAVHVARGAFAHCRVAALPNPNAEARWRWKNRR